MKRCSIISAIIFFVSTGCQKFDFKNPVDTSQHLAAPANIQVVALTESSVQLSWTDENTYTPEQRKNVRIEFEQSTDSSTFLSIVQVTIDSSIVTIPGIYKASSTYYFRAKIVAGSNTSPYSSFTSSEFDFSSPDNFQVQGYADTVVMMHWNSSNPYITHFEIEQSTDGSPYILKRTVSKETTSVSITDAFKTQVVYTYRVRGISTNNVTPYSSVAAYTVSLNQPTELTAKHLSINTIELRWKDNSTFEQDFVVERKINTGSFLPIGTVSANSTVFMDNGLDRTSRYQYRVRARSTHNINSVSQSITVYYTLRTAALQKTLTGHSSAVYALAIQPSNNTFASGSGDKTIKLWDSDGTLLRTFTGHTGQVYSVAFAPNGEWLVSGSLDKSVKIWRTTDGALILNLTGHTSAVYSVNISPDGQTIASASYDKTIRLWRTSDGALLQTLSGHSQGIYAVSFSPNGSLIASGGLDHTIKVWRVSDGALVWNLAGHTNNIGGLSFTPDGNSLLSGSFDNSIKLWNIANGSLSRTIQSDSNSISSLALSTDGRLLICGNAQENFKIWNTDKYILLQTMYGHTDAVNAVAINSSMQWFITGGGDALVKIWNVYKEWVTE